MSAGCLARDGEHVHLRRSDVDRPSDFDGDPDMGDLRFVPLTAIGVVAPRSAYEGTVSRQLLGGFTRATSEQLSACMVSMRRECPRQARSRQLPTQGQCLTLDGEGRCTGAPADPRIVYGEQFEGTTSIGESRWWSATRSRSASLTTCRAFMPKHPRSPAGTASSFRRRGQCERRRGWAAGDTPVDRRHPLQPAPRSRRRAGVAGAGGRGPAYDMASGNFFELVPTGADAHVRECIMDDGDDEQTVAILRCCQSAMTNWAKLMGLLMVVMNGGRELGKARAGAEMTSPAGFSALPVDRALANGAERVSEALHALRDRSVAPPCRTGDLAGVSRNRQAHDQKRRRGGIETECRFCPRSGRQDLSPQPTQGSEPAVPSNSRPGWRRGAAPSSSRRISPPGQSL
jgi:hypothetical protein